MGRFALLAAGALLLAPIAAAGQPASPAAIDALAREKAIWQAVKDHRLDDFAATMAPSYVGLYPDGPRTIAADVAQIRPVLLREFEISAFQALPIDPETIAATYRIDVAGQAQGTAFAGRYWVSSVWHRIDGKWRAVLHTETPAAP
jgi:hypothetical protein